MRLPSLAAGLILLLSNAPVALAKQLPSSTCDVPEVTATRDFPVYASKAGFSFAYPRSWKLTDINLKDPPSDLYPAGLSDDVLGIVLLNGPRGMGRMVIGADKAGTRTVDDYVDLIDRQLQDISDSFGGTFKILSRKKTCFAGAEGIEIIGKQDVDGKVYLSDRIFVRVGNAIYGVTYLQGLVSFKAGQPNFKETAQSFRVTKK